MKLKKGQEITYKQVEKIYEKETGYKVISELFNHRHWVGSRGDLFELKTPKHWWEFNEGTVILKKDYEI